MLGKRRFIRHWLPALAAASFLPLCEAAAREAAPAGDVDPLSLYGPAIDFDVFREGEKVGFHRVRFERDGTDLVVSSMFQVKIDFLFFTAFRFDYRSEGRWRDGQLISLKAETDDDGKTSWVEAAREGEHITIVTEDRRLTVDSPLFPTNHWNVSVLPQSRVLNTLTGRINNVRIEPRGREEVATAWGEVPASRYAYTGDLGAEVWYDDEGRWVKLRFDARDGSVIDYVCRRCQGASIKQAER